MSNPPYEITIVSHTHWDREWYRSFQEFRLQLVEMMDRLLEIMESDPDYRYFLLDGQTIMLGDYLDVRPEREATIRKLIADGRLSIGPWHILPDEFLVSPEATVRNLILGAKVCANFGARMPIGYTPDPFGHIAQLPQILAGVGLEAVALQRGLAYEPTELWWEAPDGTRIFTIYLRAGYGNLAWVPPSPQAFVRVVNRQIDALAPHGHTRHLLFLSGTDHMMPQPELPGLIAAANERLAGQARLKHGTLHGYLHELREALGDRADELPVIRGELRNSQRYNLLPGVLSTRMWIKQRNHASQVALERLAEPLAAFVRALGGRDRHGEVWRAWRYLIQNHPHDSICGCSIDQVHEEMRTRFDWTDQIAEEVTTASLRDLAASINTAALPAPESVQEGELPTYSVVQGGGDVAVLVYNPAQPVATARIEVDVPWPGAGRTYELLDDRGQRVPARWLSANDTIDQRRTLTHDELMQFIDDIEVGFYGWRLVRDVRVWLSEDRKTARLEVVFPEYHTGQIGDFAQLADTLRRDLRDVESCELTIYLAGYHRLAFVAEDVPGVGYRSYRLHNVPGKSERATGDGLRQRAIENEWFRVEADTTGGTLTITDKRTGVTYSGLNRFRDEGDRGDEYNFCPVEYDTVVDTPRQSPLVQAVDLGPEGQTLTVVMELEVPLGLSLRDRRFRVNRLIQLARNEPEYEEHSTPVEVLRVTTTAQLVPGVGRVDIRTTVVNRAEDHRLRVLFPTPIKSDIAIADSHFDRIRRAPIGDYDPSEYQELPQPTAPQRAFVAVTDGEHGLMIAARGLPEYELIPGDEGATLALTLLRCVGWLSREDLANRIGHAGPALATPGAQCLGEHIFEYSIIPFGADLDAGAAQAFAFEAPLRALAVPLSAGTLPPSGSLVSVEPAALVLTSIKPAEAGEGFIVRFYNSADEAVSGRVTFGLPVQSVTPVNLLETPLGEARSLDGSRAFTVDVPPKRIVTFWAR